MTGKMPQSYQQIKDIIQILRRVHTEIGNLCKAGGATLGDTKVGLLLETFAQRQQHMVKFLDTSERGADDKVVETWIQFVPDEQVENRLKSMQAVETRPEEFPKHVIGVQQEIAELIRTVKDEPESEEVKEFLQALADREHAEAKLSSEALLGVDDV